MNSSMWKRTGWCGIGFGGALLLVLCGYLAGTDGTVTPWTVLGSVAGVGAVTVGVVVLFGCWRLDQQRQENAELRSGIRQDTMQALGHVGDALAEALPSEPSNLARRRIGGTG